MNLTNDQKAKIFDRIFKEYVSEHGLGGMSKADFDALLLWLVVGEQAEINSFGLSSTFKVKEGRIKSLLETAAVKFDNTEKSDVWPKLLEVFSSVEFDIESLEKGQIRFQLRNPMLFRWLQDDVRRLNSTCTYNKTSEQVTMNLDVLYMILDSLWEERALGDTWTGRNLQKAHSQIKKAIKRIGQKIEGNILEELRDMKRPKLLSTLESAASLASIGSFVSPLLDKVMN